MQVTETKTEGLKRDFKVVVPAAEIQKQIDDRLKELAGTVRLPGFRPGKAPVSLMRQRYGDAVMGEVLEKTVNESMQQAISEHDLRPAVQPKVEITSFEKGADLEYMLAVENLPVIEPIDFAAIELERMTAEIPEDMIDGTLERMAQSQKSSAPITEARASRSGDMVVIDFVGSVDGEEFPGGKADGYQLELGSGSFIPGFEDQLIGAKAGDDVTVTVKFPDEYGAAELAGKEAEFACHVHEIRETAPAAIDDELAKKAGLDTLDALKAAIREEHERELKSVSRMRLKRVLLDKLADAAAFEVPESLVEEETNGIWTQLEEQRKQQPESVGEEFKDKTDDEIKEDLKDIAQRRVRLGLILAEVGRANNIKVTPEDLNRAVRAEAMRYQGHEQQVVDFYEKNKQAKEALGGPILEDRVVDFIVEMAKVTDKPVTIDELMRDPDAEPEEAAAEEKPKKKAAAKKKAPAKAKAPAKKKAADDAEA